MHSYRKAYFATAYIPKDLQCTVCAKANRSRAVVLMQSNGTNPFMLAAVVNRVA